MLQTRRSRASGCLVALLHLMLAACGGGAATSPSPVSQQGQIADLRAARDIIDYNQQASGGASYRQLGVISRWQTPVPVYVAAPVSVEGVTAALEHWRDRAGIEFQIISEDREPRILVRQGEDGLGGTLGRGLIDGTYPDNRARSGLIVISASAPDCVSADCSRVYRHEFGHALGFLTHANPPSLMGGGASSATDREAAMMRALYWLPFGARVLLDGSWTVVLD